MGQSVFVVTLQAVAGPDNSVPDGRRHHLLVFARGADEAAAEQGAREALAALGWIEPAIERAGEITDPGALPEDFRDTYRRALEAGCSVIVYDEA